MSRKNLIQRLRREVTASPKKAAILGLLGLVALYFWAPLLLGGGKKSAKATSPSAKKAAPTFLGLAPTGGKAAKPSDGKQGKGKGKSADEPWNVVAQWIDDDARMRPSSGLTDQRDPFLPVKPKVVEETKPEAAEVVQAPVEWTPESVGLKLNSTMIGPRRRTALVNGRTYEQGQTIAMNKDGEQIDFELSQVLPRRVVLTREGKQYELSIPQPAVSGRLELYGSTH